ncbi:MAG: class I SAM-dependent methyltransferase [Saprospiraceae bacterium]|nr:class I SAM-dependent methyltransferase [Saprospiraceae bacterium]
MFYGLAPKAFSLPFAMIIKKLAAGIDVDDAEFDAIYPDALKEISKIHFTPVQVAQVAARFLVENPGERVLDIGSGAGKFCMVGAACTGGHFVGIEQREHLYQLAAQLSRRYELPNVEYLHANVMTLDFGQFNAVYYFNAFYEHIFHNGAMDQSVTLDKQLYNLYTQYMREQLNKMPLGTRLATYFSFMDEVPETYRVRGADFDLKLKLWVKVI